MCVCFKTTHYLCIQALVYMVYIRKAFYGKNPIVCSIGAHTGDDGIAELYCWFWLM